MWIDYSDGLDKVVHNWWIMSKSLFSSYYIVFPPFMVLYFYKSPIKLTKHCYAPI